MDKFYPCEHCFQRYGKHYSKECDKYCDYAMQVKAFNELKDFIKSINKFID